MTSSTSHREQKRTIPKGSTAQQKRTQEAHFGQQTAPRRKRRKSREFDQRGERGAENPANRNLIQKTKRTEPHLNMTGRGYSERRTSRRKK